MKAIITGSFDPITLGHEDLIRRAARMYESLTVAVCLNPSKASAFSLEQRLALIRRASDGLDNVEVIVSEGLLAHTCRDLGIDVILRGIRGASDTDYEIALSRINAAAVPGLETVLLPASAATSHISSSAAREMLRYGGDLTPFLSQAVIEEIEKIRG